MRSKATVLSIPDLLLPMPMQYHKALCAILLIAVQQRTPALEYQPEPDTATTGDSPKACTARTRVQQYISEESRDYHGRMFEDIYITASALSDVLNCSDRTARRRLKYFEEEGIVYWKSDDSKHKHWQLTDEIAVAADETVRTEGQIINAAQIALQAAEEE
jgi:AraC-like DNA-binding protein